MRQPGGKEKRIVFGEHALIKNKKELATIVGPETLNRMWIPGREIPKVAFGHIVDEHRSVGIQNGDTSIAGEHDGPFIRRVPMQFAETSTGKPHVDAG